MDSMTQLERIYKGLDSQGNTLFIFIYYSYLLYWVDI